MVLANARRNIRSSVQKHSNIPHVKSLISIPLFSPSKHNRTPVTRQQITIKDDQKPFHYTTVTLLSLRIPSELNIFPDHLVERRFLDEENYIDLDRMLAEKAGQFDLKTFNMRDGPIAPSRVHKYDFSDAAVIQKVKNRRPKDPLTPQQVVALTSVATRYQPTSLLNSNQVQSSHVWIDDYSHQRIPLNSSQHHLPPQPLMPYQRKNPNQCELYTNQIKSLLRTYQSSTEEKSDDTNKKSDTIPILQRLFDAQRLQQNEQGKINELQKIDGPDQQLPEYDEHGLSADCTSTTPKESKQTTAFEWLFGKNQKVTTANQENLKCSTTMETPVTPTSNMNQWNHDFQYGKEDDDKQNFYSPSSSPVQQQENSPSLLRSGKIDTLCFSTPNECRPLENWFGASIYTNTYPCMPSDSVLLACDFEQ